jgi:hypothetical protein
MNKDKNGTSPSMDGEFKIDEIIEKLLSARK